MKVQNSLSIPVDVMPVVQHGAVLGPLLFLSYSGDLPFTAKIYRLLLK